MLAASDGGFVEGKIWNTGAVRARIPTTLRALPNALKSTGPMVHSNTLARDVQLREQDVVQPSTESTPPPSLHTILMLSFVGCVLFVAAVSLWQNYFAVVDQFGDNPAYIATASAIRHWSFQSLEVKQFWGLPYLMAVVSLLTGASDRTALLLTSFAACFTSIILVYRLWGGWIAGFFSVLNYHWWQRSVLGGAEPLFLALLFGTFLAARTKTWLLAALLASLSTLVRPVGLFALVAVGVTLLWRREFRTFFLVTLIGLTIGGLYVLPLAIHFGNPLANLSGYQEQDWDQRSMIGWPFRAIIAGTFAEPLKWTNLISTYGWIILILLAMISMIATRRFRQFARAHPVETIFIAIYLVFLFTYNSSYWARLIFPRLALPIVPLALVALQNWLPKHQWILWTIAIVSPVLAAASAIGIRNVIPELYY
jgi:hypothetical protein